MAVGEVVGAVLERLEPHPEIAVLFVSGTMAAQLTQIVAATKVLLAPEVLVGATVEAVFDSHGESRDGIALWALCGLEPHEFEPVRLVVSDNGRIDGLSQIAGRPGALVLFGDERFPIDELAEGLVFEGTGPLLAAGLPSRGGLDAFCLLNDSGVHRRGAVGLWVSEELALVFGFQVRLWDEDDPVPDPPVHPQLAKGALLIAGRRVDVSGMASFDLEVLFDEMAGAVIGMVGRPYQFGPMGSGLPAGLGGESVTATVYGR